MNAINNDVDVMPRQIEYTFLIRYKTNDYTKLDFHKIKIDFHKGEDFKDAYTRIKTLHRGLVNREIELSNIKYFYK